MACWQCVLLKVGVENFYCLRRETSASLAFFGWFAANELHQILLAFLVPVLGLSQPLLQHRLQLLSTLRGDIQLFKPAVQKKVQSEPFNDNALCMNCISNSILWIHIDPICRKVTEIFCVLFSLFYFMYLRPFI